jgi:general secretion pathway protein G
MKSNKKRGLARLVVFVFNWLSWTKNTISTFIKKTRYDLNNYFRRSTSQRQKLTTGFTLVEMIIVLGIIGVVSGIILVSMDTARSQSRDKGKIGAVKSIQLALEVFYAKNHYYPATLDGLKNTDESNGLPAEILIPNNSNSSYLYVSLKPNSAGEKCQSYHLGTMLENNNPQFRVDAAKFDSIGRSDYCGYTGTTEGFDASLGTNPPEDSNPLYYDVTPKY